MTSISNRFAPDVPKASFFVKLREFCRLIGVVLLQDMRTRYGGSYFGYLIAIMFPLGHMMILSGLYMLRTQVAPVGDSPAIFVGTGLAPYILCLYPVRTIQMSILQNRQLLNIPVIRPLHLIICRLILSTLNGMIVLAIFVYACYLYDIDVVPNDVPVAAVAILAAIYFGNSLGFLNVVFCAVFGQFALLLFIAITVVMYLTSGALVPNTMMPESIREIMLYNPLLNIVEWLRSAYFVSYDGDAVNRVLVIGVSSVCLALGLIGERYLRGKFFS